MRDHDKNPIGNTFADAREYMALQLDRFKLRLLEGLSTSMSRILGIIIFMMLCSFTLLFLMVGLTWMLGMWLNSILGAIFIMAGVFAVAAVIVFMRREKIVLNPMVRMFAKILFENDKKDDFYE